MPRVLFLERLSLFVHGRVTANAQVGARVHTPFAVTSRATYGYYGSKFVVISRMVIACFWLSINSYQGGGFVTQMIGAIWPSYFDLPNALGNSSGTTTRDMLSFFLFWLAQLPLMFVHPSRLGWLFATKAVVTAVVCVGTLIWVSPSTTKRRQSTTTLGARKADATPPRRSLLEFRFYLCRPSKSLVLELVRRFRTPACVLHQAHLASRRSCMP